MKLVTFEVSGTSTLVPGVLTENESGVINLPKANEILEGPSKSNHFSSLLDIIEGGDSALDKIRDILRQEPNEAIIDIKEITLKTPIPNPPQIRDCLCFEEHLIQAFNILRKVKAQEEPDPELALKEFEKKGLFRIPEVWYERPLYYKANRFSVIGTDENIIWPSYANLLDYEMEFGFFVGRRGTNVERKDAKNYIFGFSIFNDVSARDTQTIEMPGGLGPSKSKEFDTGNVIGPCIVTADEIDPYNLDMIVRINGKEVSRGSSSTIHWEFEQLIEHITQSETIVPGEFIASGTVGGGSGLELEQYLKPDDLIELEVEGIGILKNRIIKNTH